SRYARGLASGVSGARRASPKRRQPTIPTAAERERRSVAGSGTAVAALSELAPKAASQSARSPALQASGESPLCQARKSAPSTSPSASKSPDSDSSPAHHASA